MTYTRQGGTSLMFSKIFKILKESISSVTGVSPWETITKDLLKQEITGYRPTVRNQPVESCPKYSEGQLVKIRYHHQFKHLHQEVGIITEVCDFDPIHNGPTMHFYEVLVGEQKITIIERYLDGNVETEEESTENGS